MTRLFPLADQNGTYLVMFNHHGGLLELPSRTLLDVHSVVARILQASGMAKVIDRMLEDAAEIQNTASDGSTDLSIMPAAFLAC